jgi:hypothetical protein
MRPTKSAPSEVDVMLSGKAFVPGTGIDSTFCVAASTVKLSTKARMTSWGEKETCLMRVRTLRKKSDELISCFSAESKLPLPVPARILMAYT